MSILSWDPEIDTPATVAVIGAGPIGIEAALYARFLGYYALLFEAGRMADSVVAWGRTRMFTPFGLNCSSLGLAALEAHEYLSGLPAMDECVTGLEFAQRYLIPVARTDLVCESVHVHSRVCSISRTMSRRGQSGDIQDRADEEFRLVIHSKNRGWFVERADVVLDCSGTYRQPRPLGPGGGLAVGEVDFAESIIRGHVDVLGQRREQFLGKHTLLIGDGLSAAYLANQFSELLQDAPTTRLTWCLSPRRGRPATDLRLKWPSSDSDRFAIRSKMVRDTEQLILNPPPGLALLNSWGVERLERSEQGRWQVRLLESEEDMLEIECDEVIAATGYSPAWNLVDGLNVATTSSGSVCGQLHNRLVDNRDQWDLSGWEFNTQDVITSEPHYYVLGSKSFGTDSRFLIQHGFEQIRQVFSLIGGRSELNLYETVRPSGV